METNQEMVDEFHRKFGHPVGERVHIPDEVKFWNRMRWVQSELKELMDAFIDGDPVEFADALGDTIYLIYGWAVECCIPLDDVFRLIHESNMTKLGSDGMPILKNDGKVAKGPNYRSPKSEIKKLLAR